MKNFIPERMVRATGTMMRMNIDDGDIFIGEFANGALCSIQTSFVTVGNYPGIEARVYGSKGALICRLVEENGICESLKAASADQVEFRELEVPERFYPPGGIEDGVVALAVLRQPRALLHRRDPERRPGERRQLRGRRAGAGDDQRRGAVVPGAPVGVDSARSGRGLLSAALDASSRSSTRGIRSRRRSPACTRTIIVCPTGRARHGAWTWRRCDELHAQLDRRAIRSLPVAWRRCAIDAVCTRCGAGARATSRSGSPSTRVAISWHAIRRCGRARRIFGACR